MFGFRKRKPPSAAPPRRTYFDLLEEKHGGRPRERDERPETAQAVTPRPETAASLAPTETAVAAPAGLRSRRRGGWLAAALVAAALVVLWLGLALVRPSLLTLVAVDEETAAVEAPALSRSEEAVDFRLPEERQSLPVKRAARVGRVDETATAKLERRRPPRLVAPARAATVAADALDERPAARFATGALPAVAWTPPIAEPAPALADAPPGVRLEAPQPAYPAAARRAGLEGLVRVEARVDGEGRVTAATVLEGAAPALERAALEAVRGWRFEPAVRDGEPLSYRYRTDFRFELEPAERPAEVAAAEPGADVEPPVRLVSPLPRYPAAAWAEGVEGDVLVRARIDERGEVAGVEVLHGLPHGLTEAAVAAVERWKFRPATRDGRPVAVDHDLSIRFRL